MADLWRAKGSQFFDSNGDPLSGGRLRYFDATTTNPRAVYQDSTALTAWTQPIELDSAGRLTASIYIPSGAFKETLSTSADVQIYSEDNLPGAITIPDFDFARIESPVISKASNYNVQTDEMGALFQVDATGGDFTMSLPSAVTVGDGAVVFFLQVGQGGRTLIAATGGQTINGVTSIPLFVQYSGVRATSDGSNWTAELSDIPYSVLSKTSDYTVILADHGRLIKADATSAAFTVTLPAAASAGSGFVIVVKKTDSSANAVTIDGNSSETIDGSANYALRVPQESVRLRCDGSNWQVESNGAAEATITPTALSGNTNDWAPTGLAGARIIRASSSAGNVNLTGLTAQPNNVRVVLQNIDATDTITLLPESSSSTAANRFAFPKAIALRPGQSLPIRYDGTSSRWRADQIVAATSIAGGYKNLVVQATSNTAVDIDCDAITLEDAAGEAYRAQSVNLTVAITTSGANGLDTGSEASGTFYSAWVIYNPSSNTVAGLLSASATSPTLPSGYTFKARVGWVYNNGSSNLWRTIQYGDQLQIIVGTNPSAVTDLNIADATATTTVRGVFTPSTARSVKVRFSVAVNGTNRSGLIGPNTTNNSLLGFSTTTMSDACTVIQCSDITFETDSIRTEENGGATMLAQVMGWTDNL